MHSAKKDFSKMASVTIYGAPATRAFRILWMALEQGIEFDFQLVDYKKGDTRTPEFLKINPNGTVPAMTDGDLALWESLGINLYFARKYPGPLSAGTLDDEMRAVQWSMWALNEIEPRGEAVMLNILAPANEQDPGLNARVLAELAKPLGVLDATLDGHDYLLGDRFTVADLNTAVVFTPLIRAEIDFSAHPNAAAWLERCHGRPKIAEARAVGT
jgi:glutathione S-transferase